MKIRLSFILLIITNFLFSENIVILDNQKKDFFKALKEKDYEYIDLHLKTIEDINFENKDGDNLLIYAVKLNDFNLVKSFIIKGIDINHKNSQYSNSLHEASKISNYNIVEILLKYNIKIDQKDIYGHKALFYAKNNINTDIINLINYYQYISSSKNLEKNSSTLKTFIKEFDKDPIDEM